MVKSREKAREQETRRRAPRGLGLSRPINFRIKPDTRQLLEEAAREHGRTVSAEIEHQLWRALSDMGTGPTHAIMSAIGHSIDNLVRLRNLKSGGELKGEPPYPSWEIDSRYYGVPDDSARWWDDPYLFQMTRDVVLTAFEMFRPRHAASLADAEALLQAGGPRQGQFAIETTLREIQHFNSTKPFSTIPKKARYQRWLWRLKNDLGDLADRPIIWGRTAQEARSQQFPKKLYQELVDLTRKQTKARKNPPQAVMTRKDGKRLHQLLAKLEEYQERWSKKS